VKISPDVLLQPAERIPVHGVDVIHTSQLFHPEAAAARAAALPSEEEQEPLIACFPASALLALQDCMIGELLEESPAHPYKVAPAA
jgi:hypothetical protein